MTFPAPVLGWFSLSGLLLLVNWLAWAVVCFWIWKKTKALGYLVMLVASGVFAFDYLLVFFDTIMAGPALTVIASLALTAGFVLTVRGQITGELDALRKKVHDLTAGTPPATPPGSPAGGTPTAPPSGTPPAGTPPTT
ncbi:MAG: hypothetical protein ACKOSS_02445 [Planctomycetia bacterium]